MIYTLAIGDRAYSSWSLRGWLLFDAFSLPLRVRTARLYSQELPELLKEFFPAKTVPAIFLPDGLGDDLIRRLLQRQLQPGENHPEMGDHDQIGAGQR